MFVHITPIGQGVVQQERRVCTNCKGQGEYFASRDRCKQCNGRKTIRDRKILEVHIDKGMIDGQKIVFSGEGDQEPGLAPGDIVIILEEKDHPIFK